jgi:hypothetical protein
MCEQDLETLGVGANELLDLVAVFVYLESGQRCNAKLCRDLLLLISVHLVELHTSIVGVFGELLEDGGDGSARTTPLRPKVDHDDLAAVDLLEGKATLGT